MSPYQSPAQGVIQSLIRQGSLHPAMWSFGIVTQIRSCRSGSKSQPPGLSSGAPNSVPRAGPGHLHLNQLRVPHTRSSPRTKALDQRAYGGHVTLEARRRRPLAQGLKERNGPEAVKWFLKGTQVPTEPSRSPRSFPWMLAVTVLISDELPAGNSGHGMWHTWTGLVRHGHSVGEAVTPESWGVALHP